MPAPPTDWNDNDLVGGLQAECVYGAFGDFNATILSMETPAKQRLKYLKKGVGITSMSSGGMSACSAVFLRCSTLAGRIVGAVIHYDSAGDPGEVFLRILKYYDLHHSHHLSRCETYLVTHHSVDMTGLSAYNSLIEAGGDNALARVLRIFKTHLTLLHQSNLRHHVNHQNW